MNVERETVEEWIDELQCAIDASPEGVVKAVLMDGHERLCRVLASLLDKEGWYAAADEEDC